MQKKIILLCFLENGCYFVSPSIYYTLKPRQYDQHLASDIFKFIFKYEEFYILFKFHLKLKVKLKMVYAK